MSLDTTCHMLCRTSTSMTLNGFFNYCKDNYSRIGSKHGDLFAHRYTHGLKFSCSSCELGKYNWVDINGDVEKLTPPSKDSVNIIPLDAFVKNPSGINNGSNHKKRAFNPAPYATGPTKSLEVHTSKSTEATILGSTITDRVRLNVKFTETLRDELHKKCPHNTISSFTEQTIATFFSKNGDMSMIIDQFASEGSIEQHKEEKKILKLSISKSLLDLIHRKIPSKLISATIEEILWKELNKTNKTS